MDTDKINKFLHLLECVTNVTGLTFDDFLKSASGTEEQQEKSQVDNIIKMSKHMKEDQDLPFLEESKDEN